MINNQMQNHRWVEDNEGKIPFLQSPSEGRLVSTSIPSPGVSVENFLCQGRGKERYFWQNGRDQIVIAGFGVAVEMMAWGPTRFTEIQHKAESLFSDALIDHQQNQMAFPRMFGGFSFRDDFTADNTWSVFHPAHFFIPHFQLVQVGQQSWLTINAVIAHEDSTYATMQELNEAIQARYEILIKHQAQAWENIPQASDLVTNFPMSYETWAENINEAVHQIKETALQKVVLARACELRSKSRINIDQVVNYLNQNYKDCIRFLFEPRPNHAFYGATPEMLVQVKGSELNTMALAGSIRRSTDPTEDASLARQLLNSQKDRQEHHLVVDSINRRLKPVVDQIIIQEPPQVFTLSYIHHLMTPIKATLKEPFGVLPLVERLHPTPALGGSPRHLALDFIRQKETIPRGWYAAPIGWIGPDMDGEFAVAIRSAVAQERRVWLYAGAGIVADSLPETEWAETALKFQPMFAALGQEMMPIESPLEMQQQ